MTQNAIARPRCAGGKMSSMVDCDNGTSEAPKTPCTARYKTISVSVSAVPQSIDATVKPASETRNRFLRPKRADSQRTGAVTIPAATMQDVRIQLIGSSEAESEPWI